MLGDMTPFKMVGNLYFVGTYKASSHMIDTGEGLILIDVGYEETADVVIESLETLGFDVKDVKYILISHGHGDHSDGVPKIAAMSGAKIFMHEADNRYLKGFLPDVYLHDGDVIRLGNTEILCLHTPGHTAGVMSFFFNVTENTKTYRAGMFGGAGVNQLKKSYLDKKGMLPFSWRADYLASLERLRGERVDVFVGNHAWNNRTREKYERMLEDPSKNLFLDSESEWLEFLDECEAKLEAMIESKEHFVNYAHRGASEYMPENTLLSFYNGIAMRANGIETDVRKTADGVLVLFHDSTVDRMTDGEGKLEDYTYAELCNLNVEKNGFCDKIVTLEEFLDKFYFRDLTFAIELKGAGVEAETAELLRKYDMAKKTFVTSFELEYIKKFKEYAPEFRVGYLAKEITPDLLAELRKIGVDELCPKGCDVTPERVRAWHRAGFNVRAWGINSEQTMKKVYDSGADGMTVNFPDKLASYIEEKSK